MTDYVFIPELQIKGAVVHLMAYGAIIKYTHMGIDYEEMLSEEDYELITRGNTEGLSISE